MKRDVLKPKEENLFSLATELGLVVMPIGEDGEASETTPEDAKKTKPFAQLT